VKAHPSELIYLDAAVAAVAAAAAAAG